MSTQVRICQHLRSAGFNERTSRHFAGMISKWNKYSGPEWTVERLKSLKTSFRQYLQTNVLVPPDGWAVRINSKGKRIFKDPYIHRILTLSHSDRNIRLIEALLRIYTVIKLDKLSRKQKEKFRTAVTEQSPETCASEVDLLLNLIRKDIAVMANKFHEDNFLSSKLSFIEENPTILPNMLGSSKRSPLFTFNGEDMSYTLSSVSREDVRAAEWIYYFHYDSTSSSLWASYPEEFSRIFSGVDSMEYSFLYDDNGQYPELNTPAGSISVIQEGGCKPRWIANPTLPYQALADGLKRKLSLINEGYFGNVINVHDQSLGHDAVTRWLDSGRKVWSFDCTSFTDRFPVSLQLGILDELRNTGLVTNFDTDVFKTLISKSWISKDLGEVSWKVGQPLGFGPSFALATLSHALVLRSLVKVLKRIGKTCTFNDSFRVVGDDVVICNEALASLYEDTMSKMGVSINKSKSLISSYYSEFLGKLISKNGITPSMKVSLLTKEEQVVSALSFYGPIGLRYLHGLEKRAALKAFLPEPYGLGWKPMGYSYSQWLNIMKTEKVQQRYLSNEISDFFPVKEEHASTQARFELLESYFSTISQPAFPVQWNFIGRNGFTIRNSLTQIPLSESFPPRLLEGKSDMPQQNFVNLVDDIISHEGLTSPTAIAILNKYGYINSSEKPVSIRPITISKGKDHEYKSSNPNQRFEVRSLESSRYFDTRSRGWFQTNIENGSEDRQKESRAYDETYAPDF